MNIHSLEAGATFLIRRKDSNTFALSRAARNGDHTQDNGAARAVRGTQNPVAMGGYRNRYGAHTTPEGEARVLLFVSRSYLRFVAWILCDLS